MKKKDNMYDLCRDISNDLSNQGFKSKYHDYIPINKCHDLVDTVFKHIFKRLNEDKWVYILKRCSMKKVRCKQNKSYIYVKEME